MPWRIALAVFCALHLHGALAQPVDANLRNLLAALSAGTEVVMVTPLANGLLEVTRFRPPLALPEPQAEAAVAVAREQLRMLDIPNPTADQLARALAGGTIELRDGPAKLPGVLPTTGLPATVTSGIVLANGMPLVAAPGAAAAGASSVRRSP